MPLIRIPFGSRKSKRLAQFLPALYLIYFSCRIGERGVNGPQKLRVYLAHHKLTINVFAARLGTSGAAISRWANGVNMPGRHWMRLIQEETLGFIEPPDWLREEGVLPGSRTIPASKPERETA